MQVARRIEEMRAQEMPAELRRESFGNLGEGNAAGVGGKNRIHLARRVHLAPQVALQFQIFHHRFENPIALGHAMEIILEVARLNQRDLVIGEESTRPLLGCILDAFQRRGISISLAGNNDVQKQSGHARISEMSRDTRAHGTGAEHGDTTECSHETSIIKLHASETQY
jgi:hypothetical protein